MKTFIELSLKKENSIPKRFDDNRFPEILVRYFLKNYTKKGDNVIDIFAGFGTTLVVCETNSRNGFGIEYDKERFNFARSRLKNKDNIINGDSRELSNYIFPKCDFCLSSPTYMHKDYDKDPLSNDKLPGDYKKYIKDMRRIYKNLRTVMKKGSIIVIEISNLKAKNVTTLAWDVAKEVSKVFKFEGEIIVGWRGKSSKGRIYGYGYDHSYCLVFRNL